MPARKAETVAHVDVKILDRDYRLAVSEEAKENLLRAVEIVDEKMRSIREAGKISGLDRIAVMAALQLAHELLASASTGGAAPQAEVLRKIRKMSEDIDAEIKRQESLF
jgi:cell division protein ZapA